MAKISIVTPCYNEDKNVEKMYYSVKNVLQACGVDDYEHIFADNSSTDLTVRKLRELARGDRNLKVILNLKNYGPSRSVLNAIKAASGDAIILIACDLQDPPELIADFLEKWKDGYQVVFGIREKRNEPYLLSSFRKLYYRIISAVSDDQLVKDAGDFFLIDKCVHDVLLKIKDSNPYMRGLLASLGFRTTGIGYTMSARCHGHSKASPIGLMVYALNGFVNHTLFPLRIATLVGMLLSFFSISYAFMQLFLNLVLGSQAAPGIPTVLISLFLLSGVQLFLLGYVGEIVGLMFKQQKELPLVIEKERINF